jgi:hypothetical protein
VPRSGHCPLAVVQAHLCFEKRVPRFHVINARDLIGSNGQKDTNLCTTAWTLDFGDTCEELPKEKPGSVIVIFVHGYNTDLPGAMQDAAALRRTLVESDDRLRTNKQPDPGASGLSFYTFLWRGDPGRLEFGAHQTNAMDFRLERSPGGACTHWKSAALSRRTWKPDIRAEVLRQQLASPAGRI